MGMSSESSLSRSCFATHSPRSALRLHELELALVSEGLALHHLLHLRSPAIVCREDDHGRVDEVLRDLHLLHLLAEQLLGVVEERLEELLVLLVPLLLDVAL